MFGSTKCLAEVDAIVCTAELLYHFNWHKVKKTLPPSPFHLHLPPADDSRQELGCHCSIACFLLDSSRLPPEEGNESGSASGLIQHNLPLYWFFILKRHQRSCNYGYQARYMQKLKSTT